MEKENDFMEKEGKNFVTRISQPIRNNIVVFETKYYFDSVEDELLLNLEETFFEINKGHFYKGIEPVSIGEMIDLLTSIKENGSNFVQIQYNSDHLCYELLGVEIRPSTLDEINEHLKNQDLNEEKEKQIGELEKQIREIKKSM